MRLRHHIGPARAFGVEVSYDIIQRAEVMQAEKSCREEGND
jgi:hypothetical protein